LKINQGSGFRGSRFRVQGCASRIEVKGPLRLRLEKLSKPGVPVPSFPAFRPPLSDICFPSSAYRPLPSALCPPLSLLSRHARYSPNVMAGPNSDDLALHPPFLHARQRDSEHIRHSSQSGQDFLTLFSMTLPSRWLRSDELLRHFDHV